MTRFAGAVAAVPEVAMREVMKGGKTVMRASLASARVADMRLSGVGKKGARLGVLDSVKSFGPNVVGILRATGPWQLIERDTKPHTIPRLKGGRSRSTGFTRQYGPAFGGVNERKLKLPNGGVRSVVFHPGTQGKKPWAKGAAVIVKTAPELYERGIETAMRGVFGA